MTKKSKSKIPVSNFYNIYLPCQIYSGIPVRQSQSKSFISAFCNYFACLHRFPKVSDVYIITRCNWTVWEKQATCVPQLHHKSSAGLCNKHCLKIHTHTHIYIPVLYCKQSYCTNTPRVVHYPSWPFVVKKSWGLVREQLSIWFGKCLNLPTFL